MTRKIIFLEGITFFLDKLEEKVVGKKTRKDKLYVRIDGEASSVLQVVGLRK